MYRKLRHVLLYQKAKAHILYDYSVYAYVIVLGSLKKSRLELLVIQQSIHSHIGFYTLEMPVIYSSFQFLNGKVLGIYACVKISAAYIHSVSSVFNCSYKLFFSACRNEQFTSFHKASSYF